MTTRRVDLPTLQSKRETAFPAEHAIDGTLYRVHVVTHPSGPPSFVIADDGYGWLPGSYDSTEAALAAAPLDVTLLEELARQVCHVDGEGRAITLADVEQATS